MVREMRQGAVQFFLEQGRAFFRGGGGFLVHGSVKATGRLGLGANGIAPLAVVRRARTLIFCQDEEKEGGREKGDVKDKYTLRKVFSDREFKAGKSRRLVSSAYLSSTEHCWYICVRV